jgi:hypothetical protein
MPRELRVELTTFGDEGLAEAAGRQDRPVEEIIAEALEYYLHGTANGRVASRIPRFPGADGKLHARTVRLTLGREDWTALELAAEGQSLNEIASYAVVYYLAELDSGRVAEWIAEKALTDDA